ncbi:HCP-like protein, partial [Neoconidiobolus thromboides FSU 785]
LLLHEEGKLEEATELLKIAASQNHPLGLFLLGISLRHGWGCEVDTLLAFQCLQHSAESAIIDLNTIKNSDCSVAKHELTIAIHELGICFSHGWGVSRNKETAAYYFEIAAKLGDPDSQNELGHCYLNGIGVKKDKNKAAYYFRLAHDQGVGLVGNSWIFKDKYN